jgi:hypothetical protein
MVALTCFAAAAFNIVAMHLAIHLKMGPHWSFVFGNMVAWAMSITIFTVLG